MKLAEAEATKLPDVPLNRALIMQAVPGGQSCKTYLYAESLRTFADYRPYRVCFKL